MTNSGFSRGTGAFQRFVASFFLIFSFLCLTLFTSPGRAAPTDYTQTSLGYQTILPLIGYPFLPVVPNDPDGVVDDALFIYQMGYFDLLEDFPIYFSPANTVRRNPIVNTWSNTLTGMIDLDPILIEPNAYGLPIWGGPNYVGIIIYQETLEDPSFAVYPLSDYANPIGMGFVSVPLPTGSLQQVSFPELEDFEPGISHDIQNPTLPYRFHDSAPFPTTGDNPGELISGTTDADGENEMVVIWGIAVDSSGTGVSKIPIKVIHDLGSPRGNGPGAGTRPLLRDFDGDGCVDLALLIDVFETGAEDFLYTLKGDCSGNFDNVTPVQHSLGPNEAVFDLAAPDIDSDGSLELFITYPAPGSSIYPNLDPGRIDVVFDPLGSFLTNAGPSLPAEMRPTFVHGTDCDQEGVENDLLVAGLELFESTIDFGDLPPVRASDVLCFLNASDQSTTVYPKSKININLQGVGGEIFPTLILNTAVGQMGACGPGWTAMVLYPLPLEGMVNNGPATRAFKFGSVGNFKLQRDGESPTTGPSHILMAEFADCNGVVPGDSGNLFGGGCTLGAASSPGAPISGAFLLFALLLLGALKIGFYRPQK